MAMSQKTFLGIKDPNGHHNNATRVVSLGISQELQGVLILRVVDSQRQKNQLRG